MPKLYIFFFPILDPRSILEFQACIPIAFVEYLPAKVLFSLLLLLWITQSDTIQSIKTPLSKLIFQVKES